MKKILAKIFHDSFGRAISITREALISNSLNEYKDGLHSVSPKPPYLSQFNVKSSYWKLRSCGIAGVQMVLKAQLGKSFIKSTKELITEGLSLGGYNTKTDTGWYHNSLLKLANKYGVNARLAKFVSPTQIAKLILGGNYVLASIKSKSGGHLLLIHGVVIKNGQLESFIVHDPYDITEKGESKKISKAKFENLSTRRIIVFENKFVGLQP